MTGRHPCAVIADSPVEVRRLEHIVRSHPSIRVALAATSTELRATGQPRALPLDLIVAATESAAPAQLQTLGWWRSAFEPRLGIVAITPPAEVLSTCTLASLGVTQHLVAPVSAPVLRERLSLCLAAEEANEHRPRLQREVDLVLQAARAMVPVRDKVLPKGFSPRTLDVIVAQLEQFGRATAQEVASATGLSRVSVRRYLELLCQRGMVEASHDYGARGRPATRYEVVVATLVPAGGAVADEVG